MLKLNFPGGFGSRDAPFKTRMEWLLNFGRKEGANYDQRNQTGQFLSLDTEREKVAIYDICRDKKSLLLKALSRVKVFKKSQNLTASLLLETQLLCVVSNRELFL